MAEHVIVKPEKIAAAAAVLLEESLVVPAVFQREGIDQFRGAKNDTINVKVEGVLPWREYGWRNNRATEIQFDEYAERTVSLTFGGDIYNGVKLTDEQNEMDLDGWTKLARKQTEAIGAGLNFKAVSYLKNAPFEVELGVDSASLRQSLIRARGVMNRLRLPQAGRTMLVGTDIETALLADKDLNLASNVGDTEAVSALRNATLGQRYGFSFVVAQELAPNEAYALVDSAFIFATAAPAVPQSVPFGATSSYNGVALRWLRDYDSTRFQDRSIFNCYQGFRHVTDILLDQDASGQLVVGTQEHFIRAVRLELDGVDVLPPATGGTAKQAELRTFTGLSLPAAP